LNPVQKTLVPKLSASSLKTLRNNASKLKINLFCWFKEKTRVKNKKAKTFQSKKAKSLKEAPIV